jgi:hypothetical protein
MKYTYETLSGRLFLLFILFLSASAAHAVSVTASSQGTLPNPQLYESSACDFSGGNHFWSLDDSGGPYLYRLADDGSLTRTVTITNASNRNWEDITHDSSRTYMYVGDFGNNNCDRTNLRIYRIPYPSSSTMTSVAADLISFTYPDQHSFPSHWMNFDAESFFHYHHKLYIFTKADGSAVGYTKMYTLPETPGSYCATLVDSFYTNDRTTSADISPDGSSVILISNTHIHIFRNFTGDHFFDGTHTQLTISGAWTQKEGVCFSSNNEIYMTDENNGSGNHLYRVDLSTWIPTVIPPPPAPTTTTGVDEVNAPSAGAYPVPADQFVKIWVKNISPDKLSVAIFDLTGKMIYETPFENSVAMQTIQTSLFPTGVYFYKVYSEGKEVQTARLIVTR